MLRVVEDTGLADDKNPNLLHANKWGGGHRPAFLAHAPTQAVNIVRRLEVHEEDSEDSSNYSYQVFSLSHPSIKKIKRESFL